jgi:hypothetical protein
MQLHFLSQGPTSTSIGRRLPRSRTVEMSEARLPDRWQLSASDRACRLKRTDVNGAWPPRIGRLGRRRHRPQVQAASGPVLVTASIRQRAGRCLKPCRVEACTAVSTTAPCVHPVHAQSAIAGLKLSTGGLRAARHDALGFSPKPLPMLQAWTTLTTVSHGNLLKSQHILMRKK